MIRRYDDEGLVRRIMRQSGAVWPLSLFWAQTLYHVDRVVHRRTRGRSTFTSWLTGLPVVMLTTTGARSGRASTMPVLGFPDGDATVVIGSNYGRPRHPAWVHNLRAHPRATLTLGDVAHDVEAVELEGPEREGRLAAAAEIYPGFRVYVRRAAPRRIGVFRLEPRARG
jgi:deazaflavin-dependent oxidoreductase (nitroreductase family)